MPTRVLLIRHADVENPRKLLYGHLPGFVLSAKGRRQAEELGRRLAPEGIPLIAHSPLDRARETAEIIAAQMDPPPVLEPRPELREAEFSRYLQGVPYWQIPLVRPLWFVHKARRGWLDGDEPVGEMARRVLDVADDLAQRFPDQTTALISHADPLQAAWVVLDGRAETDRELTRKPVARAGMLTVEYRDGARALVS
ncbi:MAG TPA: histidine phosphatase family protein [Candidatus Dormibacteraeota bacterium]